MGAKIYARFTMITSDLNRKTIKDAAKRRFAHLSWVSGVGLSKNSVKIYLESQDSKSLLPSRFMGLPIDAVITGPLVVGDVPITPEEPVTRVRLQSRTSPMYSFNDSLGANLLKPHA
jgi:hypothetical protein